MISQIQLPLLPPYTFRPATRADAHAMHQLELDSEALDRRGPIDSLEDCIATFDDPVYDAPNNSLFAFTPEGKLAAFGWVYSPPVADREYVAYLWGEVHPTHRGCGLGGALLGWMEARGRQILSSHADGKPCVLRSSTFDHLHDRIALLEKHGFIHNRSTYRMRRDLSEPIPDVLLPDGLTLQTWTPERDAAMMAAFNESFSDHWGFIPVNAETWKRWFTSGENFRPRLTVLAMDGDAIAAFCLNEERVAENRLYNRREAWVRDLGTCRPWRRRGVASALLCHSLCAFKAAGYEFAGLGVDTENLSGALRIYERLGFRVINRVLVYSKSV